MYLLPSGSDNVKDMPKDKFGIIRTPASKNAYGIQNNFPWAADIGMNGGSIEKYISWLDNLLPYQSTCLFVVVPDVLCNPIATQSNYRNIAWMLKEKGWPIAFVAQDGQENLPMPEFDYLFIGGSTEWKLGAGALTCIRYAKSIGKPVHVGRVNSLKRTKHFMLENVDSIDGTSWVFAPDLFKKRITRWMNYIPLNINN